MSTLLKYEELRSDTECGKILNTHAACALMSGFVRVKESGTVVPNNYPPFGDLIKQLDIRDDDIFVCSYPKTGTTWTKELVWCIANDLDYQGAQVDLDKRFPNLEMSAIWNYKQVKECRLDTLPDYWTDSVKFVNELPSPRFISI